MKLSKSHEHFFECIGCRSQFNPSNMYSCPKCGDLLQICYDYESLVQRFASSISRAGSVSVWRYAEMLPVAKADAVTLGEGGTGLPISTHLANEFGMRRVFFKNEGQNPTASFKDRGMTVAITRARETGAKTVVCASTGNTSASMAAYAARAGMKAIVLVPKGKIAHGKLLQAIMHGAEIAQVRGNFDKALENARKMVEKQRSLYLVNSLNPYRIEGQKTVAFEIWEQLDRRVPDAVVVPVGNAGNISAIWKGFEELVLLKLANKKPRMIGAQAAGASPIASAYSKGDPAVIPWKHPKTVASAIRIGAPASWKKALTAVRKSHGAVLAVADREIVRAQHLLAEKEGIFAELASAASVAALAKARRSNLIGPDELAVCIITGHGLKDQN